MLLLFNSTGFKVFCEKKKVDQNNKIIEKKKKIPKISLFNIAATMK